MRMDRAVVSCNYAEEDTPIKTCSEHFFHNELPSEPKESELNIVLWGIDFSYLLAKQLI